MQCARHGTTYTYYAYPSGAPSQDCTVQAVYRRLLSQALSALKILGRGNFFDDLCECSYMSESTIQASFHQFCKYFAEEFYEEHIFLPTGSMQTKVMEDFHKVGFTGAVGSTDVTHIRWDCCVYSLVRSYTGKDGFPTIAYQVTVDHSGRVLAVTRGFAGAHNDKTIICYLMRYSRFARTRLTRRGCFSSEARMES